jgi:hypothetical protein
LLAPLKSDAVKRRGPGRRCDRYSQKKADSAGNNNSAKVFYDVPQLLDVGIVTQHFASNVIGITSLVQSDELPSGSTERCTVFAWNHRRLPCFLNGDRTNMQGFCTREQKSA